MSTAKTKKEVLVVSLNDCALDDKTGRLDSHSLFCL